MNKLYNFTFFIGLLPYFSSDCGKMYHKQNLRKPSAAATTKDIETFIEALTAGK